MILDYITIQRMGSELWIYDRDDVAFIIWYEDYQDGRKYIIYPKGSFEEFDSICDKTFDTETDALAFIWSVFGRIDQE